LAVVAGAAGLFKIHSDYLRHAFSDCNRASFYILLVELLLLLPLVSAGELSMAKFAGTSQQASRR
jgi:hypothetical protein